MSKADLLFTVLMTDLTLLSYWDYWTWKQQDIISQINGDIEPDIVQRNVIEDESEVAE